MAKWVNINDRVPEQEGLFHGKINGRKEIIGLAELEKYRYRYDDVWWLDDAEDEKKMKARVASIKNLSEFSDSYRDVAKVLAKQYQSADAIPSKKETIDAILVRMHVAEINKLKRLLTEQKEINENLNNENLTLKTIIEKKRPTPVAIIPEPEPEPPAPEPEIPKQQEGGNTETLEQAKNYIDSKLNFMQAESKKRHRDKRPVYKRQVV